MFNIMLLHLCYTFCLPFVAQHASFSSTLLSRSPYNCYFLHYTSICVYQIFGRVRGNLTAGCVYIDENGKIFSRR